MTLPDDYQDEVITRAAPRWAWDVLDEALEADARNPTRRQIASACQAMTEASEEPDLNWVSRRA